MREFHKILPLNKKANCITVKLTLNYLLPTALSAEQRAGI